MRVRARRSALSAAVLASVLCAAAPASAATLCVQAAVGTQCDAGFATLQNAITAAGGTANRDTIRMGPVTLSENATVGANNPVDIIGSGQGAGGTVLRDPAGGGSHPALQVNDATTVVSDLRIEVPDEAAAMFEAGLFLNEPGSLAERITVAGSSGIDNAVGVIVRTGALLRNATVDVPLGNANDAVFAEPGSVLEDLRLSGEHIIEINDPGNFSATRIRSSGPCHECVHLRGGATLNITDALITPSAESDSKALYASTVVADNTINAANVTVIGAGDGFGAYAEGGNSGRTATVNVRDSVFSGLATDLGAETFTATAHAVVNVDYSTYDAAKLFTDGFGTEQIVQGAHNVFAAPGFVNAGGGDYHPAPGSPLIDRGSPEQGSTTDLDGNARPTDGNADGAAVRDIGAFEFPSNPPPGPLPQPVPPGDTSPPRFTLLSRSLTMDRRGYVTILLRGPSNETAVSQGMIFLRSAGRIALPAARVRKQIVELGTKHVKVRPNTRVKLRVKLRGRAVRLVRKRGSVRVKFSLKLSDNASNSATVSRRLTLKAPRARRKRR